MAALEGYNKITTPHVNPTSVPDPYPNGRPSTASPVKRAVVRRQAAPLKSNSKGNYSKPAPAKPPAATPGPVTQSIEQYLGSDPSYLQQQRGFGQSLNDFLADITRRKGALTSEYGLSEKALGDQRVKDLSSIESDFGSRGLLRSGLYATGVGDYEKEYGERKSDLARRNTDAMSMLGQEEGQFKSAQQLKEQAAREAAIRRRAESTGV